MFGPGDPFGMFGDPFAQMNRMMGAMLGADPFFGHPGFGAPPAPTAFPGQAPRSRQPVIEEVDGEHSGRATHDEPIIEEPDDDGPQPSGRAAQRQRRHSPERRAPAGASAVPATPMDPFTSLFGALAGGMGAAAAGGGGGGSFMFSSSSFSSLGPGGVTYQASSTTRVGPGGVRETQAVVRDGRSGTEEVTISRGLGDGRARTLTRRRDATGQEQQLEDLRGIDEHEADHFDHQWRAVAERALPGGAAVGAAVSRIGPGGGRAGGAGTAQRPLALPAAGPSYTAAAPAAPAYTRQQSASAAVPPAAAYAAAGSGSGGSRSTRYGATHAAVPAAAPARPAAAGAYVAGQPQAPQAPVPATTVATQQQRYGSTAAYTQQQASYGAVPQYQYQQHQQQQYQQQQAPYPYGNAAATYAPSSTGGSGRYRY